MENQEKSLTNEEIEKYLFEYLFLIDIEESDYDYECLSDDLQFLFFLKSIYFHNESFDKHFGHIGIKFNTFMIRLLEKKPEKTMFSPSELGIETPNLLQVSCYSLADLLFIARSLKKASKVDGFGGGMRESVIKDVALWEKMCLSLIAFGEESLDGQ